MKKLKRLLYAEDETDIQIIVETIIQSMSDYELKICNNGKEVLEKVEEYQPDLIVLDVMMPEMDGLTTFNNLQANEKTKEIPIIFMTAKAQVHEVNEILKTGIIGIITKPFDPMNLITNINEIWEAYSNGK